MKNCLIIYRGPLQRSRLSLVLSSYSEVFPQVDFIWLIPHPKYYQETVFKDFISQFSLNQIDIIDGGIEKHFNCFKKLKRRLKSSNYNRLVLIGTTSIFYLPFKMSLKRDLFINGIPEERFFHNSNFRNRIQVFLIWKIISLYKVDRVFSVSKYMSEYLMTKLNSRYFYSIPSGIYHNKFTEKPRPGNKMVYSGSGAPWQWLDQLSFLWQEIQRLDPNIEFLVVSRDTRTKILQKGIRPNSIKFVQASSVEEVFNYLQEGKVGFLIRQDHLVNQVSFPIKFGEYLAAGLNVVVSDFRWECADFIKERGGGILVSNQALKKEAKKIIDFFHSLCLEDKISAQKLSLYLSAENSKNKLIAILNEDKSNPSNL